MERALPNLAGSGLAGQARPSQGAQVPPLTRLLRDSEDQLWGLGSSSCLSFVSDTKCFHYLVQGLSSQAMGGGQTGFPAAEF